MRKLCAPSAGESSGAVERAICEHRRRRRDRASVAARSSRTQCWPGVIGVHSSRAPCPGESSPRGAATARVHRGLSGVRSLPSRSLVCMVPFDRQFMSACARSQQHKPADPDFPKQGDAPGRSLAAVQELIRLGLIGANFPWRASPSYACS